MVEFDRETEDRDCAASDESARRSSRRARYAGVAITAMAVAGAVASMVLVIHSFTPAITLRDLEEMVDDGALIGRPLSDLAKGTRKRPTPSGAPDYDYVLMYHQGLMYMRELRLRVDSSGIVTDAWIVDY